MSCFMAKGGLEQFLSGGINIPTDNINFQAARLASITAVKAIIGATNATPIVMNVTAHGRSTGDLVNQVQVGGNANANGRFSITVTDADHYSLQDITTGANIAGSGAYTSGGLLVPIGSTGLDNLNDIDAAARPAAGGQSGNATTKSVTNGVFDCDDLTFTGMTAPSGGSQIDAIFAFKNTGTESTSLLFLLLDQNGGTGLPLTPNGGNVTVTFSNGTYKVASIRG
jgi:hypothetical protein